MTSTLNALPTVFCQAATRDTDTATLDPPPRMACPPYHFSTVAAPLYTRKDQPAAQPSPAPDPCTLYRGSLPAARNAPFLRPLGIKTCICLCKREPAHDELAPHWAARPGAATHWVKAKKLGEEELGMGRAEVCDVLKILLDRSAYPVYLADVDGASHTSLVVACLRKLQGWHMDSITDEVERFLPDYTDTPLAAFVAAFLSTENFALPPPPYPDWLWPARPTAASRDKPAQPALLPFAHPVAARRHPTMRLQFVPQEPAARPSPVMSSKSRLTAASPSLSDLADGAPSRRDDTLHELVRPVTLPDTADAASHTSRSRWTSASSASGSTSQGAATSDVVSVESADEVVDASGGDEDDEDEDEDEDEDDDDDDDDDDDEDDSNEYRTAPSESLYMSALDLAEVSRRDTRSGDDGLLARLRK